MEKSISSEYQTFLGTLEEHVADADLQREMFPFFWCTWLRLHSHILKKLEQESLLGFGLKARNQSESFEEELQIFSKQRERQISALLQWIKKSNKETENREQIRGVEKKIGWLLKKHDDFVFALFEKERKNLETQMKSVLESKRVLGAYWNQMRGS